MDDRIRVRIGIETGPVVVGDVVGEGASRESPVVGETPNLAARIQGIAEPNTIAIGPGCHARIDRSIHTGFLGARDLRGFPRPVEVWQVTGSGPKGDRFEAGESTRLGRFVGRGAELELLFDCWSRAKEGNATLVQVSGDPGIGKSRLVYEFLNTGRENATLLRGHCSSHGASTAFLPFRDLLHRRCGLSDDLSSEGISQKIAAAVQDVDVDQRHTPYLLKLFGITAPEIFDVDMELAGIRTREAIVAFLLAHARFRPTVLFVNDLHWIDDSSDILLSSLARQADKSPILFLSTARPEYQVAWSDHPSFTRISLSPLSSSETTILLRESLKGSSIDAGQLEMILDRAGGNPLFVEELARHAVEQRRTPGSSPAKGGLPVPDTLEGLLLQRVDKLSPQSRRLLQAASVAGRRFRSDLVASVMGLQESGGVMEELESQDLVRADVSAGGATYRFRHALVHDAVNASLLKSDRRTLHRAIGAELETRHAGRETEICEELARHFIGAEESGKSAAYCAMAGDKALGLFAINDARQWYAQFQDHVATNNERGDDQLLGSVLVNQLEVLCFDADSQGMVALAETHLPRVEMMGETAQVSRTYSWLGKAYLVMARFADAAAALEKALAIAKKLEDPVCIGYAAGGSPVA